MAANHKPSECPVGDTTDFEGNCVVMVDGDEESGLVPVACHCECHDE